MDLPSRYFVYVGTIRGILAQTSCRSDAKSHFELENIEKSDVTALEWGRAADEIIIGYKNGSGRLYNTTLNSYVGALSNLEGNGAIVGIGSKEDSVVVAKHSGVINIWSKNKTDKFSLGLQDESSLECMVQNKNNLNVFGFGGEKNDFKLWDLEKQTCTFKAKSMGHDELNLPIPTSIRGISFLSNENNLASCVTKEGHVLLYDEKAQRRPVIKFVEPKASYTTISNAYREKQCVVGTTKGYIQLIDLRSPSKCLKTYKSFTGSVTSLICDPCAPVVISTSLDRHLRIHHLDTKELLYKKYMKQSLTKLLMKPVIKDEQDDDEQEVKVREDEEYEAMFDNMETVEEIPKKKKKLSEIVEENSTLKRKKKKKIKIV